MRFGRPTVVAHESDSNSEVAENKFLCKPRAKTSNASVGGDQGGARELAAEMSRAVGQHCGASQKIV